MRQELRALLEDASLITIGAAIVLGLLLVDFLQNLGEMLVGITESASDSPFDGGPPTSFEVADRVVVYGPVLRSAIALVGAMLVLTFLGKWLERPRRED
jgi:hypothetical protein